MPLTQSDRIAISRKIIDIPVENTSASMIKDQIELERAKAIVKDNANKSIADDITPIINAYQSERSFLTGEVYTTLLEQDFIDSARKILNNFFFPNNFQVVLPSIADGVWKFFPSFSGSKAKGLTYIEATTSTAKEDDHLTPIFNDFATVDGYPVPERSTGQKTTVDGVYTPYAPIQTLAPLFITKINDLRAFLILEQAQILASDPDIARQSQNNIAIADIANTIAILDAWIAYPTFDTTTVLPATVAAYNALIASDFTSSKFRSNEFNVLKTEIIARQAYIITRASQLSPNLGTIGQNLTTGVINNTGSGLYDRRFKAIDLRLNLLTGTLNNVVSLELGKTVQDELIASNDNALEVYGLVLKSSKFRAPALNSTTIHVTDGSLFSVSDNIYVVAERQEEIAGSIVAIAGNSITLNVKIPAKYTNENHARIYKTL